MVFTDHLSSCKMKAHRSKEPLPVHSNSTSNPAALCCQCRPVSPLPTGTPGTHQHSLVQAGIHYHGFAYCKLKEQGKSKERLYLDAVQTVTRKHPAQKIPSALSSEDLKLMTWRLIFCIKRKSKYSSRRPTHVTPIKTAQPNQFSEGLLQCNEEKCFKS
ncbi:hypothetical protein BTVI_88764 [Pitangus sulphuratus]|nr:hypothetical protein BTVI_88764 [Pitangus sulphuratus]